MNTFTIPIRDDDDEPIAPPVKDVPVALDSMSDVLIAG
jgi:hypothetical protein